LGVGSCFLLLAPLAPLTVQSAQRITWSDVAPLHSRLEARGITSERFAAYVDEIRRTNARRLREGDLDHLVFYLLQSRSFTTLPPIDPALSAKALVDGLGPVERGEFLKTSLVADERIPRSAAARMTALLRALDSPSADARLTYFRRLVSETFPEPSQRRAGLAREYLRAMRFVYEKEFIAQRSPRAAEAVADLYRTRGLSTDTAVEAGYLVRLGLEVVRSLEPERRIRRVLIVGPGLDLAPRTGFLETAAPQSYQPWAVADALLALKLSTPGELEIVAADINPRVVAHLRDIPKAPQTLTLVSEIRDSETVVLTPDYREYFARLGLAAGSAVPVSPPANLPPGHLLKAVNIAPAVAKTLRAEQADIVTERFEGAAFDLVVATNILPYFDDVALMLAVSNVAAMLAPGGTFLHNEVRPLLQEIAPVVRLPFVQSRQVAIASVKGAPPLADSVFLHRRSAR
jgi:hypothetical protein